MMQQNIFIINHDNGPNVPTIADQLSYEQPQ
jgi:hypothetical protein